ncbi:MAG: hypothetical protein HQL66_12970 [Magnetococcales bacterium]|nr:hypothetical protein [Magnetococcales bacterium]
MDTTSSMQVGATPRMEQSVQPRGASDSQTDQGQAIASPDRQGSTYPVQKDTVDIAKAQAALAAKGPKPDGDKAPPPPPLGDGQKPPTTKKTDVDGKSAQGGLLGALEGASGKAIRVPGLRAPTSKEGAERIVVETTPEPVTKAIKEKVNNLFKVYPNGGGQPHREKVEVPFTKTADSSTAAAAKKQAVAVDTYA